MRRCQYWGLLITLLALVGCSQTAYVQDNNRKPIAGVNVTLTSGDQSKSSYTNKKGVAKLDTTLAKQKGVIRYEKEGYKPLSHNYPGNVSLIECLEKSDD